MLTPNGNQYLGGSVSESSVGALRSIDVAAVGDGALARLVSVEVHVGDLDRLVPDVGHTEERGLTHGAEMGTRSVVVLPALAVAGADVLAALVGDSDEMGVATGKRDSVAVPARTLDQRGFGRGALPARRVAPGHRVEVDWLAGRVVVRRRRRSIGTHRPSPPLHSGQIIRVNALDGRRWGSNRVPQVGQNLMAHTPRRRARDTPDRPRR